MRHCLLLLPFRLHTWLRLALTTAVLATATTAAALPNGRALTTEMYLPRNGSLPMTGQLLAADGTAALPGYSFSADPDTGLYRSAGNTWALVVAGASSIYGNTTGNYASKSWFMPDGTAAAPAVTFTSDTDTGLYRLSANSLGFTTAGASTFYCDSASYCRSVFAHRFADGSAAAPSINFATDTNTGIYSAGADSLGFSANGAQTLALSSTVAAFAVPVEAPTMVNIKATGATLDAAAEVGNLITNEGAGSRPEHTLPAAAANVCFRFYVQDSDGMKITAAAGDTIRSAGTVSGAAGYICDAATVGNALQLCAINATEWVDVGSVGTWTIDAGC